MCGEHAPVPAATIQSRMNFVSDVINKGCLSMNEDWKQHLTPLGRILHWMHVISYDHIFNDVEFNLEYYRRPLVCFFHGHDWRRLYRSPRNGERGNPEFCGMVPISPEKCFTCWKNRWGLKSDE